MKNNILFESKVFAVFRLLLSIILIVFVTVGFISIGYWYFGLLFFFVIAITFRNVPLKISFSESEFIMKHLFRIERGWYEEIKKLEFHYSGPFAYPKLIIYWRNKKIGFEWGGDKKYLASMLKFFVSKKVKITDPQGILKNYVDIRQINTSEK